MTTAGFSDTPQARTGECRAGRFKLTPHQQQEARARREGGEMLTSIGKSYKVHHSKISRLGA